MLQHWIWLSTLPGLTPRETAVLLRHFDTAEQIYHADRDALEQVEGLSPNALEAMSHHELELANKVLSDCYEKEIQVLTMQDAAYPARLRAIEVPPAVLYYKGRLPAFDTEPCITVVGTRRCSAYGLLCAKRFGYQIARSGGILVSGLAKGIDSAAMEGALSGDAPVVAVLGCGADVIYPKESASLYRDIQFRGCILTEYPPGTPPLGAHFPVRNRILSALSLGVLVVEAPERSGALNTARHALEQGRDVFAIPGDIYNPNCQGSNALIRDGAILVTSGWEVMREYVALFPGKVRYRPGGQQLGLNLKESELASVQETLPTEEKRFDNPPEKPYIDLDKILSGLEGDERALVTILADKPLHIDDLIDRSQLPAARVLASMTLLEMQGVVQADSGKRFSLTGNPPESL